MGLDERMEGGVPEGFIVLVCGRAGTMKSSIAFNILHKLAKSKRPALYMTLEQSRQSILEHMTKLGFKMGREAEYLVVLDIARMRKDKMVKKGKGEKIDWVHSLQSSMKSYKEMFGCDAIVIDSLAALYALAEFRNPRAELFSFFEAARDLGITSFLISEMPSDREVFGLYGVEDFLSDGIVHLQAVRQENVSNLYININKMRKTKHDKSFFPLIVKKGGFEIVAD